MNNFLIDIWCPATSKTYEFQIPAKIKIGDMIEMAAEEIRIYDSNENIFKDTDNLIVMLDDNIPLSRDETAEQAGIKSGSTIMLL